MGKGIQTEALRFPDEMGEGRGASDISRGHLHVQISICAHTYSLACPHPPVYTHTFRHTNYVHPPVAGSAPATWASTHVHLHWPSTDDWLGQWSLNCPTAVCRKEFHNLIFIASSSSLYFGAFNILHGSPLSRWSVSSAKIVQISKPLITDALNDTRPLMCMAFCSSHRPSPHFLTLFAVECQNSQLLIV